jgi:hypothetical protein
MVLMVVLVVLLLLLLLVLVLVIVLVLVLALAVAAAAAKNTLALNNLAGITLQVGLAKVIVSGHREVRDSAAVVADVR